MRQVFRKIPVYTGDVSGVCSALYELGGMVVMHDPSGCNSTYNTHDETRWYDRDSLIFLSGLSEVDAIMGTDEKLIGDIIDAARIYSPAFIAIANSPIPYITGIDFDAICRIVEKETGIPSFYIHSNGMHDYVSGAGKALVRFAQRFVKPGTGSAGQADNDAGRASGQAENAAGRTAGTEKENAKRDLAQNSRLDDARIRCNILGVTPLDFAAPTTLESLYEKCAGMNIEVVSCWAMGRDGEEDLFENLLRSPEADVNLLVSSMGLPTAQYMKKQFGIPFVAGFPAEGTEDIYRQAVREAAATGEDRFPFRDRKGLRKGLRKELRKELGKGLLETEKTDAGRTAVGLIGEPVIMSSLAASIAIRTGCVTRVFGATEDANLFLGPDDAALRGEEELTGALKNVSKAVADPCYRSVLPENCALIRLPHFAFSGRIFQKEIPDLLRLRISV